MSNINWANTRNPITEHNIKLGVRIPLINKVLTAFTYTKNKCGCTWIDTSFCGFEPCSGNKCNWPNEPDTKNVFSLFGLE